MTSSHHDPIERPAHYRSHSSGVECIEIVESLTFNVGNAIKYAFRAGLKGDAEQCLRKALWYLRREVERLRALGAFGCARPRAAQSAATRLLDAGDTTVLGDVLRELFVGGGEYFTALQIQRAAHVVERAIAGLTRTREPDFTAVFAPSAERSR